MAYLWLSYVTKYACHIVGQSIHDLHHSRAKKPYLQFTPLLVVHSFDAKNRVKL